MLDMTEIIAARRNEVMQYDNNIAMYEAILATLPTEWPEHLIEYRGVTDEHAAVAKLENLEDVTLLAQLLYADRCRASIRSEMLERTKAASILAVLEAKSKE